MAYTDLEKKLLQNAAELDKKNDVAKLNNQVKSGSATKPSTKSKEKTEPSKKKLENKKKQSQKKATATAAASTVKTSSAKKTTGYKKATTSASTQKAAKAIADSQKSYATSKTNKSASSKGNTGANRLSKEQQKIQAEALMADNVPAAIQRGVMGAAQGFVNSTVGLPSAILTGERMAAPSEALQNAGVDQTAAYQLGNIGGEFAGYSTLGALGNVGISNLLSKTKLAQMAIGGSARPIGQVAQKVPVGQRMLERFGRNALETATVGSLQNAAIARAEGLEGEEFRKDFFKNQLLDLGLGVGLDAVADGVGALNSMNRARKDARYTAVGQIPELPNKNVLKATESVTEGVEPVIDIPNSNTRNREKLRVTSNPINVSEPNNSALRKQPRTVDTSRYQNDLMEAEMEYERAYNEAKEKIADYVRTYKGKGSQTTIQPKLEDATGTGVRHTVSNNDPWYQKALKEYGSNAKVNKNADEIADRLLEEDLFLAPGQQEMIDEETYEYLNSLREIIDNNSNAIDKLRGGSLGSVPGRRLAKMTVPKTEPNLRSTSGRTLKPGGADVAKPDMTYDELRNAHGEYSGGTPKASNFGETSKAADTIGKASFVDEELRKRLDDAITEGTHAKYTKTNKTTMSDAKAAVEKDLGGETTAFFKVLDDNQRITEDNIATGYQLAKKYVENGDYDKAEEILGDVVTMASSTGRTFQAMRLFNNLTPTGKLKSVVKSAERMSKQFGKEIKINHDLRKKLLEATTEKEAIKAQRELAIDMWNQVPATFSEKLDAWRYLSMLGNPRTHIRNIVGNLIYMPARVMSDVLATAGEKALSKKIKSLDGMKTKAVVGYSGEDAKLRKLGTERANEVIEAVAATTAKYSDTVRPQEAKVFDNPVLEYLRKMNSNALENEDRLFMRANFQSAFAQYCKANGKAAADVTGDFLNEATDYAYRQALKSTYRDDNALAEIINRARRSLKPTEADDIGKKVLKKGISLAFDSAVPFVKTPANILKRGVEYSPIGGLNGVAKIITAKDAKTLTDGIENLAQGITGTGLLTVGFLLARKGVVNSSLGEDWNEKSWRQAMGEQAYAINIGDTSITLDWASPLAMPFFVGVAFADSKESQSADPYEIAEALLSITDPVFEMSMLSGINNIFDTAFSDGNNPILEIGKNTAKNYVSQFFPTLGGQIARTAVQNRKTTLSVADNAFERDVDKFIDTITNKIPGLTNKNQDFVDVWGRTETKNSTTDYFLAGLENFASPAYISTKNETAVDKELKKLHGNIDSEYQSKIVPKLPKEGVTFNGVDYQMTEDEYTQFKKDKGKKQHELLDKLFRSSEYKKASNDEKVKMISNTYDEAYADAKEKYLVSSGKVKQVDIDFNNLTDRQKNKYKTGIVDKKKYVEYFSNAETNGKSGINQDEAKAQLDKMNLTQEQKAYLWTATNSGWTKNPYA